MPKVYPREFREDVIRVARNREPGVRLRDVAADFGMSEGCLTNWLSRDKARARHPTVTRRVGLGRGAHILATQNATIALGGSPARERRGSWPVASPVVPDAVVELPDRIILTRDEVALVLLGLDRLDEAGLPRDEAAKVRRAIRLLTLGELLDDEE